MVLSLWILDLCVLPQQRRPLPAGDPGVRPSASGRTAGVLCALPHRPGVHSGANRGKEQILTKYIGYQESDALPFAGRPSGVGIKAQIVNGELCVSLDCAFYSPETLAQVLAVHDGCYRDFGPKTEPE